MSFSISLAAVDEWAAVRDLRLRALQESPTAYASTYAREIAFTDLDWQERLATAHTYLARDPDHEVVGLVTGLWCRDGDVALLGMYVAPAARGSGCADALIDAVVDLTRRRGGIRVVLQVTDGNVRAERCYRRHGFSPTGRRFARDPDPAEIEFALPLVDTVDVGARD